MTKYIFTGDMHYSHYYQYRYSETITGLLVGAMYYWYHDDRMAARTCIQTAVSLAKRAGLYDQPS